MKIRILFDVDFYQEVDHPQDWIDADDDSRKLYLKEKIQESSKILKSLRYYHETTNEA